MTVKQISKQQAGFTLVEIAIVLVIIGLLLGGILKGQEMITQAKIKNIVNDLNGMSAAIYSYQDRYRSLPGDELNATVSARWSGAFGGDGNGVLCTGTCASPTTSKYNDPPAAAPSATTSETTLFWMHLRLSGFVPGPTSGAAALQQPSNAVNGMIGVQTTGMGFNTNIICSSNLPDKVAIAVDTQVDDGAAATGGVRGQLQSAPSPDIASSAATAYQETGTNTYVVCKNL
jgi:prepilin-type N-terminal cleavage/methylation domain-containing protein